MSISKMSATELIATFRLLFGACGTAVRAAAFPNVGIGLAGVSLSFPLTSITDNPSSAGLRALIAAKEEVHEARGGYCIPQRVGSP